MTRSLSITCVFSVLFFILPRVHALTEAEAIRIALENNPDVKVRRILLSSDSLELKKAKADAGVQVSASGENLLELHPATRYTYSGNDSTVRTVESALGGSVSTHVPGGGKISASVEGRGVRDLDTSETDFTTTASLAISQPLLRDAWSNAPMDYQINIEMKNLNISLEKFRGQMLDILSSVRESYLTWISALKTVGIREAELLYTRNALEYERARYMLGEKAEMDTLTAALELLRARENLMTATYEEKRARERFALELGRGIGDPGEKDSPLELVPEFVDSTIDIHPIPSADAIMKKIEENNYELKLLEITGEILELQLRNYKNSLLPRLDVSAGISSTQRGERLFASGNATSSSNGIDPWIGITFTHDFLSKSNRYRKKQAEFSLQSNAIEKQDFIKQQKVAVDEFVDAWARDSARLAIRTAEVIIAEKNHAYAVERYQLGEIDNLAKLKAQSDLINARLNKLYAEVNLKRLEIAVDKATTNVFDRFGVTLK